MTDTEYCHRILAQLPVIDNDHHEHLLKRILKLKFQSE